ncbi:Succinyl-diaminopimelate desuccinylase [Bienertia sinuspersici]
MGNCQAVDAAALVIQHPSGKVERMYWSITANEVMKMNPGHYVSLIIPLPMTDDEAGPTTTNTKKTVRYTRVKLLRPTDTLVLGRAYRLVTSQEVKKVLIAKKKAKMNEKGLESDKLQATVGQDRDVKRGELERISQGSDYDRQRLISRSMNSRSKTWRPSLQSISEATS